MSITFQCHVCGKTHSVNDRLAGRLAKCTCGINLTIPSAATDDDEIVTDIELIEADPPAPPPQHYPSSQYPWLNAQSPPVQAAWNPAPAAPGYPAGGASGPWNAPQAASYPPAAPQSQSPSQSADTGAVVGLRYIVGTVAIVHALYILLECRHLPAMVRICRAVGSAPLGVHAFLQVCFAIACVALLGVGIAILARARPAAQIGLIVSLTMAGIGLLQMLAATPWAGPYSVFGSLDQFAAFLLRGVLMRLGPPVFIAWWCYAFGKSR